MSYKVILHLLNAEPVLADIDELPSTTDVTIVVRNPRHTDGKDLVYLAENVAQVYWPIERLNFIEILSNEEEENIFGFVRE